MESDPLTGDQQPNHPNPQIHILNFFFRGEKKNCLPRMFGSHRLPPRFGMHLHFPPHRLLLCCSAFMARDLIYEKSKMVTYVIFTDTIQNKFSKICFKIKYKLPNKCRKKVISFVVSFHSLINLMAAVQMQFNWGSFDPAVYTVMNYTAKDLLCGIKCCRI